MPHWLQPMEPCTLDLPAAHGVQLVAFPAEKKPAAQCVHTLMSSVSLARKRPAAHPLQRLAPLRRYVPAAHHDEVIVQDEEWMSDRFFPKCMYGPGA